MRLALTATVGDKQVPCEAVWDATDSAFVKLVFGVAPNTVEWDVPREGLYTGMELRPGGDMGIAYDNSAQWCEIVLIGPMAEDEGAQRADVRIFAAALIPWLAETGRVVPIGSELADLDFDLLLHGAAPEPEPLADWERKLLEPDPCIVCDPDSASGAYIRDFSQTGVCPSCGRSVR